MTTSYWFSIGLSAVYSTLHSAVFCYVSQGIRHRTFLVSCYYSLLYDTLLYAIHFLLCPSLFYCSALCNLHSVLSFILLYCTHLCFMLLYSTLPYPTLLYSTLPYSTLLYSMLRYPRLPCPTLPYPTLLCCTLLYSAVLYSSPLYTTLLSVPLGWAVLFSACSAFLCSSYNAVFCTLGSTVNWMNVFITLFPGPGLKPPAENTLQYLEDVAVQTAK